MPSSKKSLKACAGPLDGPCPHGCQVAPPRLRCSDCGLEVAAQRDRAYRLANAKAKPKIGIRLLSPCQGPIKGTACPHQARARNHMATRCEACQVANRSLVNKACHRAYADRKASGAHFKNAGREQRKKLWAEMEALERQDPRFSRYSGREGLKALAREAGLVAEHQAA